MKKILLNGVDGNFGQKAAKVLLEKWPHEDLIFTAPTEKGLEMYKDVDVEKGRRFPPSQEEGCYYVEQ